MDIKLLTLDFDGVLTDNKVVVDENGKESVVCDRSDGLGIELIKEKGVEVIVISRETNKVVQERCKKLKIPCINGVKEKKEIFLQEIEKRGLNKEEVCYVGNDVNDIECLKIAGFAAVVKDAHLSVKKYADHITKNSGGHGAVREVIDLFLEKV